jgi:hypothetical protein
VAPHPVFLGLPGAFCRSVYDVPVDLHQVDVLWDGVRLAPLLVDGVAARAPRLATTDVVDADVIPKRRKATMIGMPVKSNLRKGIQGKGILRPENLRA